MTSEAKPGRPPLKGSGGAGQTAERETVPWASTGGSRVGGQFGLDSVGGELITASLVTRGWECCQPLSQCPLDTYNYL